MRRENNSTRERAEYITFPQYKVLKAIQTLGPLTPVQITEEVKKRWARTRVPNMSLMGPALVQKGALTREKESFASGFKWRYSLTEKGTGFINEAETTNRWHIEK